MADLPPEGTTGSCREGALGFPRSDNLLIQRSEVSSSRRCRRSSTASAPVSRMFGLEVFQGSGSLAHEHAPLIIGERRNAEVLVAGVRVCQAGGYQSNPLGPLAASLGAWGPLMIAPARCLR